MLKALKKSTTLKVIKREMNQITDILENIFTNGLFLSVIAGIGAAFTQAGTFLLDMTQQKAIFAVVLLVSFDALTAWYRDFKTGFEIESQKIQKTVMKILIYMLILSAGHMANLAIPGVNFVMNWLIGWLALKELVSILENFGKAGHGMPSKLLNKLPDYGSGNNDNNS